MMHLFFMLNVIIATSTFAVASEQGISPKANTIGVDCGAHSLFCVSRCFNRGPLLYSEFREQFARQSSAGYSAAEIADFARAIGLFAEVVQCKSISELDNVAAPFLAILHLKENHFVPMMSYGTNTAMILDPLSGKSSSTNLHDNWDGFAIIISDRNFEIPSSNGLSKAVAVIAAAVGLYALVRVFGFPGFKRAK